MKAGILAAGLGERLRQGGIDIPKPLVTVAGLPLIARAIRAAADAGATSIACIVNEVSPDVGAYLESNPWPVAVEVVVKTTPSSMESLFGLAPLLCEEPFLLLTVDAVFRPGTLARFLSRARDLVEADGVLALTRNVDDEKPLWARMAPSGAIRALGENARPSPFVTAGFYYFRPAIFSFMEVARARKLNALRQFLALLPEKGLSLCGVPVPKTMDIDHPDDLENAEMWLRGSDAIR